MTEFLPREVRDGLEAARRQAQRRHGRMQIEVGGHRFTILRYWDTGFAVSPGDAQQMRGLVDLYDGSRHLGSCLVQASGEDVEQGEQEFEFKRNARPADGPALDFVRDDTAPAGYLPHWIPN